MANTNVTFSTLGQPVKNDCSPDRVYGGFEQTIFLGASVSSFSASVGWNEQTSDVTVTLVEDTCPAPSARPKVYWDSNLNKQTTAAADPGFIGETVPIIGVPVYFRVGDFEFSGIVQSWEENNSSSGKPVYTVKISDGRSILDGVHLIINEYAGGVGSQFNAFNVYGYMESFGESCPLTTINGAQFGTPAGGFGGSNSNNNGMAAADISRGFNVLSNSIPATINPYSPYGRVVSKGTTGGSYGVVNRDGVLLNTSVSSYYIDISELPTVPSYYRINGISVTLSEYVSRICQDAGYDYYWEMVMVKNNDLASSGIGKFLKLRTASRLVQPSFGEIQNFIDNSDGTISSSTGRELRQEAVASILVGGNVEGVFQAEQHTSPGFFVGATACDEEDDMILPYFGLDSAQDIIVPCRNAVTDEWEITVDATDINAVMTTVTLPTTVTITEAEIRAVEGSMDVWLSIESAYHQSGAATDIGGELYGAGKVFGRGEGISKMLQKVITAAKNGNPIEFAGAVGGMFIGSLDGDQERIADIKAIYEWIKTYSSFYGTHFMVRVPYTCAVQDPDSTNLVYSEQPQQDGWTDESQIIGLSTSGLPIKFFINQTGKVEAMVRIDGIARTNLSELDVNTYITDGSSMWIKASVEDEEWVYHDKSALTNPRAVISIPHPVNTYDEVQPDVLALGIKKMFTVLGGTEPQWTAFKDILLKEGSDILSSYFPSSKTMPDAASFGIKNNVLTYGPWTNTGVPGPIRIERNDGLVPWEYDGTTAMNAAGQALANEGITNMVLGEMGSVSVPGYPDLPLGAEIGALAGGFYGGGTNLIENRNHSIGNFEDTLPGGGSLSVVYGFFTYGGAWTGLYGPNITNISLSVGTSGLTTSYTMRTFTPKFGRFAKLNSERLRQQGQLRNEILTERASRRQNFEGRRFKAAASRYARRVKDNLNLPHHHGQGIANTSHHLLTGQYGGAGVDYASVSAKSAFDVVREIGEDYASKHFMGLDSVFIPYDTNDIVTPTEGTRFTRDSFPNVLSGECGDTSGAVADFAITSPYLDSWSNPSSSGGGPASRQENSGEHGHNQTFAGRGTGLGTDKLHLRAKGIEDGETNDWSYASNYRVMALRGPINIKMFGYDTNGKPVPNAADTESSASDGNFTITGLQDKFLDGFLKKPETWPVAPVDLRLDRERGVWVSPPQPRNLMVELCGCLTGSGVVAGKIIDSMNMYDDAGDAIGEKYVNVSHRFGNNKGRKYGVGERVYVTYDAHSDGYAVAMDEGVRFQVVTGTGSDLGYDDYGRALRFGNGFGYTVPTGSWADCADILRVDVCLGSGLYYDEDGCLTTVESGTGCVGELGGRTPADFPDGTGEYYLGIDGDGCFTKIDATGVGGGIETGDNWLEPNGTEIFHLIPGDGTTAANSANFWQFDPSNACGLTHDDAGHIVGYHNSALTWKSPSSRHADPSATFY